MTAQTAGPEKIEGETGKERGRGEMPGKPGHRNKMRDECVLMHHTIMQRRNIPLADLAEEMGVNHRTARRWVHSFGAVMPVEIRRGIVTIGDGCL